MHILTFFSYIIRGQELRLGQSELEGAFGALSSAANTWGLLDIQDDRFSAFSHSGLADNAVGVDFRVNGIFSKLLATSELIGNISKWLLAALLSLENRFSRFVAWLCDFLGIDSDFRTVRNTSVLR